MTEVTIRNKQLLKTLDSVKDRVMSNKIVVGFDDPANEHLHAYYPDDAKTNGEYYCTQKYLLEHAMSNPKHVGFPFEHFSMPVQHITKEDPSLSDIYLFVRNDFIAESGAGQSALFNYYPPGGFVGWHTNENNPGLQMLFTWAQENASGYFQYYDMQEKQVVRIIDNEGWSCRHYRFGYPEEPQHLCWHSAYTDSHRITIAIKWNYTPGDEKSYRDACFMRDQFVEEIESEE